LPRAVARCGLGTLSRLVDRWGSSNRCPDPRWGPVVPRACGGPPVWPAQLHRFATGRLGITSSGSRRRSIPPPAPPPVDGRGRWRLRQSAARPDRTLASALAWLGFGSLASALVHVCPPGPGGGTAPSRRPRADSRRLVAFRGGSRQPSDGQGSGAALTGDLQALPPLLGARSCAGSARLPRISPQRPITSDPQTRYSPALCSSPPTT